MPFIKLILLSMLVCCVIVAIKDREKIKNDLKNWKSKRNKK